MAQHRQSDKRIIYVDGRAVYTVVGKTLRKRFREHHILRKPPGLAVDVAVLDEAEAMGATHCQFTRIEGGAVYQCPIEFMRRHGVTFNRGYGAQTALPLEYWTANGQQPVKRPRAVVDAEKAAQRADMPQQMGLFEVAL